MNMKKVIAACGIGFVSTFVNPVFAAPSQPGERSKPVPPIRVVPCRPPSKIGCVVPPPIKVDCPGLIYATDGYCPNTLALHDEPRDKYEHPFIQWIRLFSQK